MPTTDRRKRLRASDVPDLVAAAAWHRDDDDRPDRVGLEVESLAVQVRPDGSTSRLSLRDAAATAAGWAREHGAATPERATGALELASGARITFEPGGQIEVSAPCRSSVSGALAGVQDVLADLARAFARRDAALVSAGVDLWHDVADVPQQLTAPRYPAMAAYLASRSPAGSWMMRQTASIQVNVDPGRGSVADERWLVANLVAPLATASFATSPGVPAGATSRRAGFWRALDPTRTGFPARLVAGDDDRVAQLTASALEADVLLVRTPDGGADPGRVGWRFKDWLDDGHPTHGYPDAEDLRYHLTTLFHEVRPRGALEIRSIDALPARWRVVPAVLYAGLLYDDRARAEVLRVLEPTRSRLPALLRLAGAVGVSDAGLCASAVETWSFAVEGARRLGPDVVDRADVRRAEAFIDRFTMRGRCPGDELREAFVVDRAAARSWATEPVPTVASC